MKIYDTKPNLKWQKKVKWPKTIIIFVAILLISFIFLFLIIGKQTLLVRAILTSLIISSLISFGYALSCVLNYEEIIPVIYKKELYLIIKQRETDFYDTDIKRHLDLNLEDEKEVSKVLSKNNKKIGLASLKVSKCEIIKEKKDKCIVKLEGTLNKWEYYEKKKEFGYELKESKHKRKITIDKTYKNYKDLIKTIKKEV